MGFALANGISRAQTYPGSDGMGQRVMMAASSGTTDEENAAMFLDKLVFSFMGSARFRAVQILVNSLHFCNLTRLSKIRSVIDRSLEEVFS